MRNIMFEPPPSVLRTGANQQRVYRTAPVNRPPGGSSPSLWNASPQNRRTTFDDCQDITEYALKIVQTLEIPEDERCEKEEFKKELDAIVQSYLPSIYFP
jgi:hypothetical protein